MKEGGQSPPVHSSRQIREIDPRCIWGHSCSFFFPPPHLSLSPCRLSPNNSFFASAFLAHDSSHQAPAVAVNANNVVEVLGAVSMELDRVQTLVNKEVRCSRCYQSESL